jgi:hypothetical protein
MNKFTKCLPHGAAESDFFGAFCFIVLVAVVTYAAVTAS